MKKAKLNEEALFDELKQSAFFRKGGGDRQGPSADQQEPEAGHQPEQAIAPSLAPSHHGACTPSDQDGLVETIRQAVREVGRLAGNYRFTQAEKKALNEIRYTYSQAGISTSDNQIARIGLNLLIQDYRKNGKRSILARVLQELNK